MVKTENVVLLQHIVDKNETFDYDNEVIKLDTEQGFGYLNTIHNLTYKIKIKFLSESFTSIV